jgi:trans-aconitate methyltransferase
MTNSTDKQSLLYSHRLLYHGVMRLLYGRHFEARYTALAAEIPAGSAVVDVCAGDCYLYLKYLRHKPVQYQGLDISPQLVRWAQKRGVSVREFNVWQDEVPGGDVVIMQASMYQFIPHQKTIVQKLLAAAREKVIIAEPIRNLSSSHNPLLAIFSQRATTPATEAASYSGQRFNRQSLTEFFNSFETFERSFTIPGEREMVGVFRKQKI